MAKNDKLPSAVLAQYMRKDTSMLLNGVWYISTPCEALRAGRKCLSTAGGTLDEANGLVDERVTWAEAKTPHHAGLIADRRHVACSQALDAELAAAAQAQELEAAAGQVDTQKANLKRWQERVAELEPLADQKNLLLPARNIAALQRELDHARTQLARHEEGMLHAVKRLQDMRAAAEK